MIDITQQKAVVWQGMGKKRESDLVDFK